jgi:hypothetical protein
MCPLSTELQVQAGNTDQSHRGWRQGQQPDEWKRPSPPTPLQILRQTQDRSWERGEQEAASKGATSLYRSFVVDDDPTGNHTDSKPLRKYHYPAIMKLSINSSCWKHNS